MHCWSTGTTSSLRWILDPRSHSLENIFGRTLVLIGALDHVSKSTPTGSNNIALWVSVQWKSNVVRQCYHSPRCCKQRCFVAWPELDSSFPIRHQRTILYAKGVSRCAHSGCAWDCTKMNAQLHPRNGVLTKFFKARPFPFPYADAVEKICGDYRATVNPCLHVQQHHIPRIEELFAKLRGRAINQTRHERRIPAVLSWSTKPSNFLSQTRTRACTDTTDYVSVRPL